MRHGRAPLLAFGEELLHLEHFGPLEVTKLRRPAIDARRDQRQRRAKLRVAIALDDLRGDVRGLQSELLTNRAFDRRIQMRMRADRAAEFSDADPFLGLRQSFLRPPEFVEHQGELEPEGDRLRMNAVAAADHRRHLESARLRGDRGPQVGQILRREFAMPPSIGRPAWYRECRMT